MTREEARELISKHSYKDELGRYVISKKVAFIITDCLENEALQNRSCENCKFLDIDLICTNLNTPCYSEYSGRYDNFRCSEWKSK